jgi:hypothetical protein
VLVDILIVVLFLLWFGFCVLTALVCEWACVVTGLCASAHVTVVAVLLWCDSATATTTTATATATAMATSTLLKTRHLHSNPATNATQLHDALTSVSELLHCFCKQLANTTTATYDAHVPPGPYFHRRCTGHGCCDSRCHYWV